MDNPQSEIRRQIEITRSDMAEKISALQERIDGAVDEVKHLVDPKYQVEHRPWLMVGLSLVAGYLTSRLLFARPAARAAAYRAPRQGMGPIGGFATALVMGLARDFAANLLKRRRAETPGNGQQSAQSTASQRLH